VKALLAAVPGTPGTLLGGRGITPERPLKLKMDAAGAPCVNWEILISSYVYLMDFAPSPVEWLDWKERKWLGEPLPTLLGPCSQDCR
jgi:hypothetical protein